MSLWATHRFHGSGSRTHGKVQRRSASQANRLGHGIQRLAARALDHDILPADLGRPCLLAYPGASRPGPVRDHANTTDGDVVLALLIERSAQKVVTHLRRRAGALDNLGDHLIGHGAMKAVGAEQHDIVSIERRGYPDLRLQHSRLPEGALDHVIVRVTERLVLSQQTVANHLGHQGVIGGQAIKGAATAEINPTVAHMGDVKDRARRRFVDDHEGGGCSHRGWPRLTAGPGGLDNRCMSGIHSLSQGRVPAFGAARANRIEANPHHDLGRLTPRYVASHAIRHHHRELPFAAPGDTRVLVLLACRAALGDHLNVEGERAQRRRRLDVRRSFEPRDAPSPPLLQVASSRRRMS